MIAGVDEVGRGAWAGPVFAAAAAGPAPAGVRDSKALSAAARARLDVEIRAAMTVALGAASVAEIDAMGVGRATFLAMERAVAALPATPSLVLVDGLHAPRWAHPTRCIVRGDATEPLIAAASIAAKVARDALMAALDGEDGRFAFARHKGYGTRAHTAALAEHGPGPHHRRSFAPVRAKIVA